MRKNKNAVTNKKKNAKIKDSNLNENSIMHYLKPKIIDSKIEEKIKIIEENSRDINYYNNSSISKDKKNFIQNNALNSFIKSEVPESYIKENNDNYKNKIIINDVFIDNFRETIKNSFERLEYVFGEIKPFEGVNFYSKNVYNKINENMDLLLIKFFLHIEDNFLYVPNILSNIKIEDLNKFSDKKHKIKLFEGMQNSMNKKFSNKSKKNNKNPQKAFVLFDDIDYVSSQKIIESVCNDLDYHIIKIDDLESKKLLKLNKISEATQSQRITSISDIVKEKLGMLEKILNNNQIKFISFFNNDFLKLSDSAFNSNLKEKNKNFINGGSFSNNNSNMISNKEITKYFAQDTKERKIYNNINSNLIKFLNKKKTLILLSDSFSNFEESKSYINSIIGKINDTKCPIVILTSK